MASLQARAKEFVNEEQPKESAVNASPELQQLADSSARGVEECACAIKDFVECISVFMYFLEIVVPKLAGRSHDGMLRAIAISIVLSIMRLSGREPCFSSIKPLYEIDTLRKAFMYLTYMCATENVSLKASGGSSIKAADEEDVMDELFEEDVKISKPFFSLLNKMLAPASNASLNMVLARFGMLMAIITKDRKDNDTPDVAKGYLERTINAGKSEAPTASITVEPYLALHKVMFVIGQQAARGGNLDFITSLEVTARTLGATSGGRIVGLILLRLRRIGITVIDSFIRYLLVPKHHILSYAPLRSEVFTAMGMIQEVLNAPNPKYYSLTRPNRAGVVSDRQFTQRCPVLAQVALYVRNVHDQPKQVSWYESLG